MALDSARPRARRNRDLPTRLVVANSLLAVVLLLLAARLYALQVLRGEELSHKGRRNFVSQVQVPHDRGIIYDRFGRILVDNRPSHALQLTPAFLGRGAQRARTLMRVGALADLTSEEVARIHQVVASKSGLERFRAIVIKRDLDPEQIERIESERSLFLLDGVDIVEGRRRSYVYGELMAHLLGYTSEIDANALDAERARGNPEHYDLGDLIGRDGLERTFEKELRGTDGALKVVVDAKGRRQQTEYLDRTLGGPSCLPPKPGHNIFLTLDLDLQQRAEEAFFKMGRAGSVVAMDPKTGAVLVLASLPAFNANAVSSLTRDEKDRLDRDPLKPWLNRSIQGQYAPGSTFKIVPALAGLEQRAIRVTEKIGCPGHYKMGRHTWRCHRDSGHGPVDLREAIKASCDVWFYTLGGRIGIDPIARMARLLSFGTKTGIALRGEQSGLVPDEAFHNRANRATGGYTRGMAINTSIGQGALLVTPLQMAVAYSAIANGKAVLAPQLVHRIESADMRQVKTKLRLEVEDFSRARGAQDSVRSEATVSGHPPQVLVPFSREETAQLNFASEDLEKIRDALRAVADEPGGTAYRWRSTKVSMAAKTGTAQVVKLGVKRMRTSETAYLERDHAWAVAYAPAENPEIVVVVLNEHAGHGGSASAPIAVEVLETYFDLKNTRRQESDAAERSLWANPLERDLTSKGYP